MRSALVVAVPEAIDVVDEFRESADASHALGLPPHVTVIYPFGLPEEIGAHGLARVRQAVQAVPAATVRFSSLAWFGDEVLWLKPDSDVLLAGLVNAVVAAFPQFPPYGGVHAATIPHLTIGSAPPASSLELGLAEASIARSLPVETFVQHLDYGVFGDEPGSWQVIDQIPLGKGSLS